MVKAIDCIEKALQTFKERGAQYGDSYIRHGEVMKALLPTPVTLETEEDFARFGVLNMMVSKMVRYCQNFKKGHIDSTHDLGVYSFIMEELDTNAEDKLNKI